MSVEENKAVVRRFHEILNERRAEALEALGEVLAEDYVNHSGTEGSWSTIIQGQEQVKEGFGEMFREHSTWQVVIKDGIGEMVREHPPSRVVIDDIIGEGDKVAIRWTRFEKEKPTHNALVMFRLSDGKIVDDWYCGRKLDE